MLLGKGQHGKGGGSKGEWNGSLISNFLPRGKRQAFSLEKTGTMPIPEKKNRGKIYRSFVDSFSGMNNILVTKECGREGPSATPARGKPKTRGYRAAVPSSTEGGGEKTNQTQKRS